MKAVFNLQLKTLKTVAITYPLQVKLNRLEIGFRLNEVSASTDENFVPYF